MGEESEDVGAYTSRLDRVGLGTDIRQNLLDHQDEIEGTTEYVMVFSILMSTIFARSSESRLPLCWLLFYKACCC